MKPQITHNIAFLIPLKNEEKTIYDTLSSINSLFPGAFICVTINDTTDASETECISFFKNNEIDKKSYQLLNIDKAGKANAIKQAFMQVTAKYYILIDADGQHKVGDAITLLETMKTYNADMVIGSRFLEDNKTNYPTGNRQWFNFLYNKLIKLLFNVKITDALSGFRIISNRFVETLNIKSNNFELEAELLISLISGNYKLEEVPISITKRSYRNESKLNLVIDGLQIITFTIINYFKIKIQKKIFS